MNTLKSAPSHWIHPGETARFTAETLARISHLDILVKAAGKNEFKVLNTGGSIACEYSLELDIPPTAGQSQVIRHWFGSALLEKVPLAA